jgi:NDP-sugar pyrophosphorylase family protein
MQCLILAGGLGTRMLPHTATVPKTLLPVNGRPFADYQLRWLKEQGVTDVVYCIGHLGEMISEYVGDGSAWGLNVVYSDEGPTLLGTAGAVRLAFDRGLLQDETFILYGDSYLRADLPTIRDAFGKSGKPALMTVLRNQGRWDTSNVDYRDARVLYDKRPGPHRAQMEYIDYGLLLFSNSAIQTEIAATGERELANVLHSLSLRGQLAGYEVHDRFYEIGSPAGLADLEVFLETLEPVIAI